MNTGANIFGICIQLGGGYQKKIPSDFINGQEFNITKKETIRIIGYSVFHHICTRVLTMIITNSRTKSQMDINRKIKGLTYESRIQRRYLLTRLWRTCGTDRKIKRRDRRNLQYKYVESKECEEIYKEEGIITTDCKTQKKLISFTKNLREILLDIQFV